MHLYILLLSLSRVVSRSPVPPVDLVTVRPAPSAMFDHKREGRLAGFSGAAGFHRDTQCKSFKRLLCRECQNVPDCCQKLATKGVKAVGAHLPTNPPVGEMGDGAYWPRLRGRGYFCV